jgi:hypothetical protein
MASPYRLARQEDPYSPLISDDLLGGANDWRNVQDIVRLTFKALSDVVRAQGASLRELERQMPNKLSKSEFNSGMAIKANASDISRTVQEVFVSLESKLHLEDLETLLADKVSRSEVQYLISSKASELRTASDTKADSRAVESELHALRVAMDETQKEVTKRWQQATTQRDLQQIYTLLDTKANAADVEESLNSKANKQTIANALHKKANRTDVDSLLARKAEVAELQTVLDALQSKADQRSVDHLTQTIGLKAEHSELSSLIQEAEACRHDQDDLEHRLTEVQQTQELRIFEQLDKLEELVSSMRHELDEQRLNLTNTSAVKADRRDVERIAQALMRKADVEGVASSLAQARQELHEALDEAQKMNSSRLDHFEQETYQVNDGLAKSLAEYRARTETDLTDLQSVVAASKTDWEEIAEAISKTLERNRVDLDSLYTRKADKSSLAEARQQLTEALSGKAENSALQDLKAQQQRDLLRSLADVRENLESLVCRVNSELCNLLDKKANSEELKIVLSDKADLATVHRLASARVTTKELEDVTSSLEVIVQELRNKADLRDLTLQTHHSREAIDALHSELSQRPTIKDVRSLVDSKASLVEVERSLSRLNDIVSHKVHRRELQESMLEQQQWMRFALSGTNS